MKTAPAAIIVSILSIAAGCEASVSLDGLTGGDSLADSGVRGRTDPSSVNDGGKDESAAEAGGDPSSDDAGSTTPPAPDDGGTPATDSAGPPPDAGSVIDSGGAPVAYCASLSPAPLFCDDFDNGALGGSFFQVTSTGGSASLSSAQYVSPANAMLVTVNPNASSSVDIAGYQLFATKGGLAATFTFAFDLRVDVADTSASSDAVLAAIQFADSQGRMWDLEFEVAYSGGALAINNSENGSPSYTYVSHPVGTKLALKTWTRVSMKVILGAPGGGSSGNSATLSLAGTQVASHGVNVNTVNGAPEIIVGATYAASSPTGWSVRYDNVTFTVQ